MTYHLRGTSKHFFLLKVSAEKETSRIDARGSPPLPKRSSNPGPPSNLGHPHISDNSAPTGKRSVAHGTSKSLIIQEVVNRETNGDRRCHHPCRISARRRCHPPSHPRGSCPCLTGVEYLISPKTTPYAVCCHRYHPRPRCRSRHRCEANHYHSQHGTVSLATPDDLWKEITVTEKCESPQNGDAASLWTPCPPQRMIRRQSKTRSGPAQVETSTRYQRPSQIAPCATSSAPTQS